MPKATDIESELNKDEQAYKPGKNEETDDEEVEELEEQPQQVSSRAGNKRKREEEQDKDGNHVFQLSNKRRVTVRAFSSGEPSVDIREVYLDKKTNEMRPGKGICLPIAQWNKLKELLPDIEEAIKTVSSSKK